MQEIRGNIWDLHTCGHWAVVTTNGAINSRHEAVLGAGVAKQARDRFRGLASALGRKIQQHGNQCFLFEEYRLATFPTKHNWRDNLSDMELIRSGARQLVELFGGRPAPIFLVRPGVGQGGLDWGTVKAVIAPILDDRFIVVEWDK